MLFTTPIIDEFHAAPAGAIRGDGKEAKAIRNQARGLAVHTRVPAWVIGNLNLRQLPGCQICQYFSRVAGTPDELRFGQRGVIKRLYIAAQFQQIDPVNRAMRHQLRLCHHVRQRSTAERDLIDGVVAIAIEFGKNS